MADTDGGGGFGRTQIDVWLIVYGLMGVVLGLGAGFIIWG